MVSIVRVPNVRWWDNRPHLDVYGALLGMRQNATAKVQDWLTRLVLYADAREMLTGVLQRIEQREGRIVELDRIIADCDEQHEEAKERSENLLKEWHDRSRSVDRWQILFPEIDTVEQQVAEIERESFAAVQERERLYGETDCYRELQRELEAISRPTLDEIPALYDLLRPQPETALEPEPAPEPQPAPEPEPKRQRRKR